MKTSITLLAARIAAALLLTFSALGAMAKDYDTTLGAGVNVTYAVNTTDKIAAVKKVTVTGSSTVGAVTVPATIKYKSGSKTYTLKVTKIQGAAFSGAAIEQVNIPAGIVSIGNYAFSQSKIKSFTIPSACTSLGEGVFSECEQLTSLTIEALLTSIPVRFAYNCYNLKYVLLPSTVSNIGHRAFWMSGLESIDLPNSLRTIGDQAFERACLKGVTVPEGVQTLGEAAFLGNGDMTWINLPSTLVSGGPKCLAGLTALATIRCNAVTPPAMGADAIDKYTCRADIWIPAASADAYRTAPEWSKFNYDAYTSGVSDAAQEAVSVRAVGNSIIVAGSGDAALFSLDGIAMEGMRSADGVSFSDLRAGVYIVRAGSLTKKIEIF